MAMVAESVRALGVDQVERVVNLPGNQNCADCGASDPQWVSVNNGCLVCLQCAGVHRGLGVKISFVKSLYLDEWSTSEYNRLLESSNEFVNNFFISKGESKQGQERYLSETGGLLRATLLAMNRKESLPTALEESEKQLLLEERRGFLHRMSSARDAEALKEARPWIPDEEAENCMICGRKFNLVIRRHHCRACGRCCCYQCAPKDNTKPILQLGYREPVRHCKQCFRSAHVKFS